MTIRDSLIMTQGNLHVHSSLWSTHAPLSSFQTRSKYGLTLRQDYVVPAFITSGPLRLPYALNSTLRSLSRLYAAYHCRNTVGTQGSQVQHSYSFNAFKRPYPGSSTGACALCFPVNYGLLHKRRRSAYILSRIRTLPAITVRTELTGLHHSLYAAACGFGRHP